MSEEDFDQAIIPHTETEVGRTKSELVPTRPPEPNTSITKKETGEGPTQERIETIGEELRAMQEERQQDLLSKVARRYQASDAKFGEGVGTSQSFLNDREKYGTPRATLRLIKRTGILAETGDTEIFKKKIDDFDVSLGTMVRGATIVILSSPQMLAQAFSVRNPLLRRLAGITNPYPRLFTEKARERYSPPPEYTSGTFDSEGRPIKS